MESKFTLNIENNIAIRANNYAKKNGWTLSNLVENYLLAIVKREDTNELTLTAPIASTLFGSLKAPDKDDYNDELEESLMEKYL